MKYYRIILILTGVVVIMALTVGITLGIQKSMHRKVLEKRMPYFTKAFGKENSKDMLNTIRTVRAIEELGLGDEQMGKFISLSRRRNELKKVYREEKNEKIEELKKLLKGGVSTGDLGEKVTELKQLEDKFKSEKDSIETELDNLLTIEQQARYIIFENKFQHEMKRFMGKGSIKDRCPKHIKNKGDKGFKGHPTNV